MKKLLLGLTILVALASSSFAQIFGPAVYATPAAAPPASTVQVLVSTPTILAGSSIRFIPVGYSTSGGQGSDYPATVIPAAGTLQTLRARAVTAPTGAQTIVVTLMKNGLATTLACTITSSVNPCALTGTNISVSPGDYIDIRSDSTGMPSNSIIQTAVNYVPTNSGDTIIPARGLSFSNASTQAQQPFSDSTVGSAINRERGILPENGTLSDYYLVATAPGGSATYTMGIDLNASPVGTPSNFAVAITGAGTTGNDTTNTASVTSGQNLEFLAAPSGTPISANISFGARFVPATSGDFVFIGNGAITSDSSSLTTYYSLTGTASTTEANIQNIANAMTVTKLVANVSSAPGAGTTKTFTLNKNGVATALTCPISDTSTSCSSTGTVSVADGDLLDVSDAPTVGAPVAVPPSIAVIAN